MMKIKSILLIGATAMSLAACSNISPGHVGVKVNSIGSDAGVESKSLPVGWYMTGPTTHIYEYPVFTQTVVWTRSLTEGSDTNEEIIFQDKNGLSLSADISVSYQVDPTKAPLLFQKYRTDMNGISAGPLRSAVRNAITEVASQYGVEEIYGAKKAEVIAKAQKQVEAYFDPYGLVVSQLYWASNIRVPKAVENQINAKIANEQAALAAQASVATATAEAESEIAKAKGKAEALKIEGEAIRTNPEIVQMRAVEKWNGHLPV
jgi:regulator of protease activity HflC (stomatin/prohibitin superfamily)